MISSLPFLTLFWVALAVTIEAVQADHGGRRSGSCRSFVSFGHCSLGGRNDEATHEAEGENMVIDKDDLVSSMASGARLKGEGYYRLQATVLASRSQKRQPREQSAQTLPAETDGLERSTVLEGAAEPLIPKEVWARLTGDEYDDPEVVERLAQTGLLMATKHNNNGWIEWKGSIPSDLDTKLDQEGIEVITGKTLLPGYGSEVPWIKSISKLPFPPSEMVDLMMDSSRVKSYNSLSLGREDVKIIPSPEGGVAQATKIVRNVVQLPVTNNKVESVTLLHTRKLESGAHLLVSRALGGTKYYDASIGTGYTLLGVNLFEPIANSPDECRLTAISHVYSPGVPLMVAGKVGVKSAKNFVKDIRTLCIPAP